MIKPLPIDEYFIGLNDFKERSHVIAGYFPEFPLS
jgi:hypothetical protein